jgi:hypothetical protein
MGACISGFRCFSGRHPPNATNGFSAAEKRRLMVVAAQARITGRQVHRIVMGHGGLVIEIDTKPTEVTDSSRIS